MLSQRNVPATGYWSSTAFAPTEEVSRHKCLIYEGDPSEQLPVVIPFLLDGLGNNWRCLYLGSPKAVRMAEQALAANGINTANETKRGALILSTDNSHLNTGAFEPKKMVDWLSQAVDDAVNAGFSGLCATGDMKWELGEDANFDHLAEYEARLEQLFRSKPLRGICQYHRDVLPPQAVRNALAAHRSAYVGAALQKDNFFYIPPELTLDTHSRSSELGEWMCQQIVRVQNAEGARDKAMSALRESEAKQRLLAEQLAEMNCGLEQRVQQRTLQLEQANRELEAFSYSVSHDLRSPLQHINGFASLLAEDYDASLDGKGKNYLERIRQGTKRMGELIDDLLRLAKLAKAELKVSKVELSTIAESVISTLKFREPGRQVEVKIEKGIEVHGDPGLLRSAMENLLSNAWKYSVKTPDAVIEFAKVQQGAGVAYVVRDNGAGFDMKYSSKLFEPFQRMHTEQEFAGHGIGLATVQRIIQRHGGKIWAEAEPGKGASFYFTLGIPSAN